MHTHHIVVAVGLESGKVSLLHAGTCGEEAEAAYNAARAIPSSEPSRIRWFRDTGLRAEGTPDMAPVENEAPPLTPPKPRK